MCKNQLSEHRQWLVWFSVLSSLVRSPRETESRILRNMHGMGKKNNKSIVSGSETIDGGLPAEPLSHTHGLYRAFPSPSPRRARFGVPFYPGCHLKGNSVPQHVWPAFFILPVGGGFVCVGSLTIPGRGAPALQANRVLVLMHLERAAGHEGMGGRVLVAAPHKTGALRG